MRCEDVAERLPAILDAEARADRRVVRHVETCLRCQAELARYRRLLRVLHEMRFDRPNVPAGPLVDVLAALEEAAHHQVIRSALTGRRIAYAGGAAASALLAAALVVVAARHRRRSGVRQRSLAG